MKVLAIICQVLLGLMFIVFGLNGFLHFLGTGPTPPPDSLLGKFGAVMVGSGWFKFVFAIQVLGGILVLIGRTAPLGLVLLGPVIVNILLFHTLLTGGHEIAPGAVAAVLEIALVYFYRANFAGIFTTNARPVT